MRAKVAQKGCTAMLWRHCARSNLGSLPGCYAWYSSKRSGSDPVSSREADATDAGMRSPTMQLGPQSVLKAQGWLGSQSVTCSERVSARGVSSPLGPDI